MTAQDQSLQTWWVKHYTDSKLILKNAEYVEKWMKMLTL